MNYLAGTKEKIIALSTPQAIYPSDPYDRDTHEERIKKARWIGCTPEAKEEFARMEYFFNDIEYAKGFGWTLNEIAEIFELIKERYKYFGIDYDLPS